MRIEAIYIVASDYDCDGITDTVMTLAAFDAQRYFKSDEVGKITGDTFRRYVLPNLNEFERGYLAREGSVHHFGGKSFRLPSSIPTVR